MSGTKSAASNLRLRVLSAHIQDQFNCVAWSPDGTAIATASNDRSVRIWDALSGTLLRSLEGHTHWVTTVAWSPDGTLLASGSFNGCVLVWNTAGGTPLCTIEDHARVVTCLSWSPDGTLLAGGFWDSSPRVWVAASGTLVRTLGTQTSTSWSVSWSPDGTLLACGSSDKTVRVWDATSGNLIHILEGHTDWVRSVSWAPFGKSLASASDDKTVRVWDTAKGKLLRSLEAPSNAVWSVSWSPDGKLLACGSRECGVRLWDAASGRLLRSLQERMFAVASVSWSPDSRLLACQSGTTSVRVWDVASGEPLRSLDGHADQVRCGVWSPDGTLLASGAGGNTLRLWDGASGELLRTLKGHGTSVRCVVWSPDGTLLASGAGAEGVLLWDVASGKLSRTLEGHTTWVTSLSWSPDGRLLASGSEDNNLRVWASASGKLLRALTGHTDTVNHLTWSPDGKLLASGSNDTSVRLWDIASGSLLCTLEGHSDNVHCVSWSPDGKLLASGSGDKSVRLWSVASGTLSRTLEGHTGTVKCVTWSPDGELLASGSLDHNVRVWNPASGACVGRSTMPRRTHELLDITFRNGTSCVKAFGRTPSGDVDIIANQFDVGKLLGLTQRSAAVNVVSAKVVLVGESSVGKSYLAHRIVTGSAPMQGEIQSTHGMKFWSLAPEQLCVNARSPEGQRRNVVLWDMGGQEEYRLVHQLFLHDTTVALVLCNVTRGDQAFREVEVWNKYLEKQLAGRKATKLLIGAQVDRPSALIDRPSLELLRATGGFAGYHETSAITGNGIEKLCQALHDAIDWDGLAKTSRPELFQKIHDEIEKRRERGEVVLHLDDIYRSLSDEAPSDELHESVRTVLDQLAAQGVVACARLENGESVVVLQIHEIERYAGSLIVAARNSPRNVPALELRTISVREFNPPGITEKGRLDRLQERAVLDCTVRLLVEHGICFEHEGLLVFPTLFPILPVADAESLLLPHAVSLYYDFSGAIDNIFASLIAWLVVVKDFGQLRLWPDRAEFESTGIGVCGVRKVGRPGGFAHVDLYFGADTPEERREQFISFVEDHLARHGVEIREHVAIQCACGELLPEETLRKRIARGDSHINCPVCDLCHNFTEGATAVRKRDPRILQHTWALKGLIEQATKNVAQQVAQRVEAAAAASDARAEAMAANPTRPSPIRLLHLSDLHFDSGTSVHSRLQWLLDDVKYDSGLGFKELDYLVVSGDFTDRANPEGFDKAYKFISELAKEFALSAERCILVPGNHDVAEPLDAYVRRKDNKGLLDGEWVERGGLIMARDPDRYPQRFKPFSDAFYHKFLQRPYPMAAAEQGISIPFWETRIQFLTLNSCWEIDEFDRRRAGIHPEAVATALKQAQQQVDTARLAGQLEEGESILRIAVWHHAVTAPDNKMKRLDFLGNLQKNDVRLAMHGDVHELRRELIGYWHSRKVHVIGGGSFGARAADKGEAIPRLYNVLEIERDFTMVRVHTREQRTSDGHWQGWHEWPDPGNPKSRVAFYDISLNAPPDR